MQLVPCFLQLPPEDAHHHLVPVASGACILGSHRTVVIKEMGPGRKLPPEHCADCISRHSLSVKASWLVLELHSEQQASGLANSSLWSCPQGIQSQMPLGTLLPRSSSPASPRKEIIHSSGGLIFATAAQGTLPDCLASEAYACGPTGMYTSAHI